MAEKKYAMGLDFGTESCRALLVDVSNGEEVASAVHGYGDGVIDERLPSAARELPPDWALQNPRDYLESLRVAVPAVLAEAGIGGEQVIGVGVDFTSCTMLPTDAAGQPLCLKPEWAENPHAWVKLWKHHAAQPEADRINELAQKRGEAFLARYGGKISSEWFFPKALQILDEAPEVYAAADRLIEAGDWLVWQLTGVETRNSCCAGYKGMWDKKSGFPSREYLRALDPRFEGIVGEKMKQEIIPLGSKAGEITPEMAKLTRLRPGTPVAVAVIDAHVAMAAATIVRPGKMLMIMGTSLCHMIMGEEGKPVPGISGIVEDGILPGFFGYEAGQPATGDIFAWFTENCVPFATGEEAHAVLQEKAARLRPGESGLLALDWMNGNRSVLVDADLSGLLLGLRLDTRPEQIYRALLEASAFGTLMIIENFERQGVAVEELYACGGLPERNQLLMQIFSDVTAREIKLARSAQTCALGSAMFGALAAGSARGGYDDIARAAAQMAGLKREVYRPDRANHRIYRELFKEYTLLHDHFGRGGDDVMKRLKGLRARVSAAS